MTNDQENDTVSQTQVSSLSGYYKCAKGHVTQTPEFRYTSTHNETNEVEADTGPMCRVCVLNWVGTKFRTFPYTPPQVSKV